MHRHCMCRAPEIASLAMISVSHGDKMTEDHITQQRCCRATARIGSSTYPQCCASSKNINHESYLLGACFGLQCRGARQCLLCFRPIFKSTLSSIPLLED